MARPEEPGRSDGAGTDEITWRGLVSPVDGLKEKTLAAAVEGPVLEPVEAEWPVLRLARRVFPVKTSA